MCLMCERLSNAMMNGLRFAFFLVVNILYSSVQADETKALVTNHLQFFPCCFVFCKFSTYDLNQF